MLTILLYNRQLTEVGKLLLFLQTLDFTRSLKNCSKGKSDVIGQLRDYFLKENWLDIFPKSVRILEDFQHILEDFQHIQVRFKFM